MKKKELKTPIKDRKSEKGAALVMVIMISFLLLVASAGLLLETTMNTANVTDATAEQQAYNAAESGIQSAINVMRGNTTPTSSPMTDTITYAKAIRTGTSNLSTDTSTEARLSRWLTYSSTNPDRVTLGIKSGETYNPNTGFAFKVSLSDPDNISNSIDYTTTSTSSGIYNSATKTFSSSLTVGTGTNTATIKYNPATISNLNISSGSANSSLGSFTITPGSAATTISTKIPFQIVLDMTDPYLATRVIRGNITPGIIQPGSPPTVRIEFIAKVFELMGSFITLDNQSLAPTNGTATSISTSMTGTEPQRLLIKSTGYGPRGAQKQLEAIIQKNFFEGLSAPAALTLVGSSSGFDFSGGNSNNVAYSGVDIAVPATGLKIPSIGTTNQTNLDTVIAGTTKTPFDPAAADISAELPLWLQNPYNLDATIERLKGIAKASGGYSASGVTPDSFGNVKTAQGITFADGDVQINKDGGGILVCTGTLDFKGGITFNGLIIVTGAGGFQRSGGGQGILKGNTVIAPYNPKDLDAGFLGPKYGISGGGTSNLTFDSSSVANGLTAVSNFVLGVAEK